MTYEPETKLIYDIKTRAHCLHMYFTALECIVCNAMHQFLEILHFELLVIKLFMFSSLPKTL